MILNLGDFLAGSTVYIPWHTFNAAGASVTMTGLAVTDIEVYKNGIATTRASDNGYTLLDSDGTDFDGAAGLHGISIDLSDNSDAGFYAAGNEYWVAVNAITIGGQTVRFWAATFSIENRNNKADIVAINGNTLVVPKLVKSLSTIVEGLAQTGTLSVTQMTTDVTEATNIHFNGRVIIWTGGALKDQAARILDYVGTGGLFTFTEVTDVPVNNDPFIIV